jgi:hypothetical protein
MSLSFLPFFPEPHADVMQDIGCECLEEGATHPPPSVHLMRTVHTGAVASKTAAFHSAASWYEPEFSCPVVGSSSGSVYLSQRHFFVVDFLFVLFVLLGIELRTLCLLDRCCTS